MKKKSWHNTYRVVYRMADQYDIFRGANRVGIVESNSLAKRIVKLLNSKPPTPPAGEARRTE